MTDVDRSDLAEYLAERHSSLELATFIIRWQWDFSFTVGVELCNTLESFGAVTLAREIAKNVRYFDLDKEFPGFWEWCRERGVGPYAQRHSGPRHPLMGDGYGVRKSGG